MTLSTSKKIRKTTPRTKALRSKKLSPSTPLPAAPSRQPSRKSFTNAVGRRKSATAYLRYIPEGPSGLIVNSEEHTKYFPTFELQHIVSEPLTITGWKGSGTFSVRVGGGGKRGQAEAVRLAISRLLAHETPEFRIPLKRAGLLTRDPRVKERKKYGLKRARRAPQWQKR